MSEPSSAPTAAPPAVSPRPTPWDTPQGEALQIIFVREKFFQNPDGSPSKKEWEIGINESNLDTFIGNLTKCGASKISVVSVLGQYRTGKSFLLDLMLKKLQSGASDTSWLQGKMTGDVDHLFTYRKQRERLTTGIWVYSQPYVQNDVAIVLMDTQGLFDLITPMEINKAVFSMTTLLSSYQILNIQNRVSEDALQQLEFFTEFARSAVELNNKSATKKIDLNSFKFQRLEFLVRDYHHFDDETNYKACKNDMIEFLKNTFNTKDHDDGTRDRIQSMFDTVSCFGLPHPGKCVNATSWDGELSDLDPEFKHLVNEYFTDMFLRQVVDKQPLFPAQTMSPKLLKEYIMCFTEVFQSGKLPEAVNLSKAFAKSIHLSAKDHALETYNQSMDQVMNQSDYVGEEELETMHKAAAKECFDVFESQSQYGKIEDRTTILEDLKRLVEDAHEKIIKVNKARMATLLNKYALAVLVALVAWVADRISDFTCDWWLDECRKFSNAAWTVYMLVIIVIVVFGVQIYRDKGQLVLLKSLTGLAGETLEKASVYWGIIQTQIQEMQGKSKKD